MKVALVGCGNIGRLRAEALYRSDRHRLVVAADVNEERAADVARGDTAVRSDWREALDAATVDAVVVSTPPSSHAEICRGAAEAGCHVLCEKPLARSPEECREILDAAREGGIRIATGFNFRFYPPARAAKCLLDQGVLGKVTHLRGHAGYRAVEPSPGWLHDASETGGGALRDIGVHLIDLTRLFLGEVDQVEGAVADETLKIPECEDNADLLLTSEGGAVASLHVSWTEWRDYRFWLELHGTKAVARLTFFPMFLSVSPRRRKDLSWRDRFRVFPRSFLAEHLGSYESVVVESLVRELDGFADFISGQPTTVASAMDGTRAVEIADAVTAGIGDGKPGPGGSPRGPSWYETADDEEGRVPPR